MSHIQPFFRSYIQHLPKSAALTAAIQSRNSMIVNYPLLLQPTPSNRLALYSQSLIRKDNDLFLISMNECIFSSGFTSSSQSQQIQISETMQKLMSTYESMSKDFLQKIKIYIQLMASLQSLKSGLMPLREYAEYVSNMSNQGLAKSNINSRYLFDLYSSWQRSNQLTFSFMKDDLLKRVEEEEFLGICNRGRMVIRGAGNSQFLFAAPFLDKLDHSSEPNCQFQMMYLPHRRCPFIRIRTIKQIAAGQRPTINYGKLNNYQLLMRYGFCQKDNPNSVFMLPLNFQNIIEIFNKNIEWKQKQLLDRGMRLKNYVRLLPSGELGKQDLTMMRILICDGQNPSSDRLQSPTYDKLINKFISDHAQGMRKNIKINNLKVSTDKHIKLLQDEEISILDKYLSIHGA